MQAVILVGGLGTRLGKLTQKIPKPMIDINGKPYLEYQIKYLNKFGITDILMLSGYLNDIIKKYFGDGSKFNCNIKYSIEEEPLGTAGALKQASNFLDDNFYLIYGDSFLAVDYDLLKKTFLKNNKKVLLSAFEDKQKVTDVKPNIKIDDENYIVEYVKDNNYNMQYIDAGVMVIAKSILNSLDCHKKISLENEVFPQLIKQKEIKAFIVKNRFYDIGTLERLKQFREYVKNDKFGFSHI